MLFSLLCSLYLSTMFALRKCHGLVATEPSDRKIAKTECMDASKMVLDHYLNDLDSLSTSM